MDAHENNCTEVYEFRSDGAGFVQSGDERSDVSFSIADQSAGLGFYALTLKTVVDYGGNETKTYVIFDPTKQKHLSCAQPNFSACFGPLNRVGQ